jgi:hypothetical protein
MFHLYHPRFDLNTPITFHLQSLTPLLTNFLLIYLTKCPLKTIFFHAIKTEHLKGIHCIELSVLWILVWRVEDVEVDSHLEMRRTYLFIVQFVYEEISVAGRTGQ